MLNAHPEDAQLGWTPVFPEVLSSVLHGVGYPGAPVGQVQGTETGVHRGTETRAPPSRLAPRPSVLPHPGHLRTKRRGLCC